MTSRIQPVIDGLVRYRLLGATIVGGALLLAVLIVSLGPSAEPAVRTEKAWPVSTMAADPRRLQPIIKVFGKVESRQMASLKTSVTAPVAAVITPEGSRVQAGELMIVLDDAELELAVTVARAEYKRRLAQLASVKSELELARNITGHHESLKEIAEARLKRHQDLYDRKMIASTILDEARKQASESAIILEEHLSKLRTLPNLVEQHQAAVDEGKAMLDRALMDIAQTRVTAPFAGRVMATHVSVGDRVLPGDPLISVADYDEIEVRVSLPTDAGRSLRRQLDAGAPIVARVKEDGHAIELAMHRLAGDIKSGQSGLDAFFRPVGDVELDIGKTLGMTITLPEERDVVPVPVQSIYQGDIVYRVIDNRLQSVVVEQVGDFLAPRGEYRVLIRSRSLAPGDRLVTTQLPRAISGLLVDTIEADSVEVLVTETAAVRL